MAKQIICPGKNLGELVSRLDPIIFASISGQISKDSRPICQELDNEDKKYYENLRKWGETREDMVANLRAHVTKHNKCMEEYKIFLLIEANNQRYIGDVKERFGIPVTKFNNPNETARMLDRKLYLGVYS